jgi:hypothetical protein
MKYKALDLRPTQLTVGMKEVDFRVKKLRSMKVKELEDYLHERRVPVVLAPLSRAYLVDHHHLVRACWESGIEEVPVEVKADFSKMSFSELWDALRQSHWIFPYDQWGNGPHDPVQLPETVRCMGDDPYRSLAWRVREEGGYLKTDIPFAEFRWATYFRKELKTHPVFDHFEGAVKEALELCRAPAAKALPGYSDRTKVN